MKKKVQNDFIYDLTDNFQTSLLIITLVLEYCESIAFWKDIMEKKDVLPTTFVIYYKIVSFFSVILHANYQFEFRLCVFTSYRR